MRTNRGSGGQKGGPLPAIVLRVEQEVRAHDRHAQQHHHQDAVHQKHESIHVVELRTYKDARVKLHDDHGGYGSTVAWDLWEVIRSEICARVSV